MNLEKAGGKRAQYKRGASPSSVQQPGQPANEEQWKWNTKARNRALTLKRGKRKEKKKKKIKNSDVEPLVKKPQK